MIKSAMPEVWDYIYDELSRRRLNAAWLARKLDTKRQTISGWKIRGVPPGRFQEIADLFGWTLDRLTSGPPDESAAKAADVQTARGYSPMALDVARMLDEVTDEQQKRRAYALIVQIIVMGNAPSPAQPPNPPVPSPVALVRSPIAKHRPVK